MNYNTKKIILSGGPHTGKTTLMNGLRETTIGQTLHFVPEPAELIITDELERAAIEPGYEPIVPTRKYDAFVKLVVARSVELEGAIPPSSTHAILDRSLIDNIGYARLNDRHDLVPSLKRRVDLAKYAGALICDFVGVYQQTAIRPESEELAHAIHDQLVDAYEESGIPLVYLPPVDEEARLELAVDAIRHQF